MLESLMMGPTEPQGMNRNGRLNLVGDDNKEIDKAMCLRMRQILGYAGLKKIIRTLSWYQAMLSLKQAEEETTLGGGEGTNLESSTSTYVEYTCMATPILKETASDVTLDQPITGQQRSSDNDEQKDICIQNVTTIENEIKRSDGNDPKDMTPTPVDGCLEVVSSVNVKEKAQPMSVSEPILNEVIQGRNVQHSSQSNKPNNEKPIGFKDVSQVNKDTKAGTTQSVDTQGECRIV